MLAEQLRRRLLEDEIEIEAEIEQIEAEIEAEIEAPSSPAEAYVEYLNAHALGPTGTPPARLRLIVHASAHNDAPSISHRYPTRLAAPDCPQPGRRASDKAHDDARFGCARESTQIW